ncbi:MAG: adenylosuccinate lyase [Clostridia bacterium]|nr:adenylosuccinate lyase [Clostridia bacterium]
MYEEYSNPLTTRYASKEMSALFSEQKRIVLFRRLWVALAEGEKKLGLPITDAQIEEMIAHLDDINFDVAKEREKVVRHDVMAHVYAYGQQCPKAAPIIHLGATSCYVTDNADLIIYHEALELLRIKLVSVMKKLSEFAIRYKDLPTLGLTHLQPAQPVTVGKRACLWLQDLEMDYENISFLLENMKLRGVKGTTGTQASFLELFDGDHEKVKALDTFVVKKFGFSHSYAVSGQTYTRKTDYSITSVLSMIAQSGYKFGNDIRLLQSKKEIEEPFEKTQIGSSAMAYKRNPMRTERLCSIARYVMTLPENTAMTAATQWAERTLDDSANRRIVMGQAFMGADAILELYMNVLDGLVVYEKVIQKHVEEELPFMATENILMEAVKRGGNRQELHEKIRVHSMAAGMRVKMEGKNNDLIDRIRNDEAFSAVKDDLDALLDPQKFIGRSAEQVLEYVESLQPIFRRFAGKLIEDNCIKV